jgi:dUTP diphosphatase
MEILAKVLHPDAVLPVYANEGDAGCDLVAVESCTLRAGGGRALVATGFAIAIPEGHGGFVLPRSGLAAKHGVTCINAPGLIDAGYRGEVRVLLLNTDPHDAFAISAGDRIAQLVLIRVELPEPVEVTALETSARGDGGFGSSGGFGSGR